MVDIINETDNNALVLKQHALSNTNLQEDPFHSLGIGKIHSAAVNEEDAGVFCAHHKRASLLKLFRKTLRRMGRHFLYAALARVVFGISKALIKHGLSPKFPRTVYGELTSTNPLKWGAVVAGISSYRFVDEIVQLLGVSQRFSGFISGAVVSLSVNVMNVKTRTELGLYIAVRALHGFACENWGLLPTPLRNFQHWDSVTMCLTAIQILYTTTFQSNAQLKSYNEFIVRNTGFHPMTLTALAGFGRRHVVPEMFHINRDKKLGFISSYLAPPQEIPTRLLDAQMRKVCRFTHPAHNSCFTANLLWMLNHLLTFSLPLYVPLKLSTTVLFKSKLVLRHPVQVLARVLKSSFYSALFLTIYALTPLVSTCVFAHMNVHSPALLASIAGIGAGLATYLEPKKRRLDLALYCSMQALRSTVLLLYQRGYIPRATRQWIFWLNTVAIACIFRQYDTNINSLHPNMRSILHALTGDKKSV